MVGKPRELRERLKKARSSFKRTFAKPKPRNLRIRVLGRRVTLRKKPVSPTTALARSDVSRVLELQKPLVKKVAKRRKRRKPLTLRQRVMQLERKRRRR